MMIKRRGRPKKGDAKESDDEDFNPYRRSPPRAKKIKLDEDGVAVPTNPGDFKIKRKSRGSNERAENPILDKQSLEQVLKSIKYSFEKPNINKLFEEIIDSANDEVIMSILKQVLSAGYKAMSEKRYNLKKRWLGLKNSNMSEQEYRQKEKELKVAEVDEINEIREEICNKLCATKITGFQTKEQIIERIYIDLTKRLEERKIDNPTILEEIQEREYKLYKQSLFELIDRLLSEKVFIEDFRKLRYQRGDRGRGFDGMDDEEGAKTNYGGAEMLLLNEGKESVSLARYFGMARARSNQAQPQPAKADIFSSLKEKSIEELVTFTDADKNLMKKYEFQTLTDSANEKLIIDENFLKNQREQFSQKMRELDKHGPYRCTELTDSSFKELVVVSNFIINSIHNVNKNDQYDLLIHPNDLLCLLDRFK